MTTFTLRTTFDKRLFLKSSKNHHIKKARKHSQKKRKKENQVEFKEQHYGRQEYSAPAMQTEAAAVLRSAGKPLPLVSAQRVAASSCIAPD